MGEENIVENNKPAKANRKRLKGLRSTRDQSDKRIQSDLNTLGMENGKKPANELERDRETRRRA